MSRTLRRRLSLAALTVGLGLAVGIGFAWLTASDRMDREAGPPRQPPIADLAPPPGRAPPARPRLEIPAIGVSAHAVNLGLQRNGSLEVPKDYAEVGLWEGGPKPGERGPAVIAGHVDTPTAPAVFHRLRDLRRGDRVQWEAKNGDTERFAITRTEEHPKADFPTEEVYGKTRRRELRLVTCSGPPDSSGRRSLNNLIVFARKAS